MSAQEPKRKMKKQDWDELIQAGFYVHNHEWEDNHDNEYEGVFKVKERYFEKSTNYRENLKSSYGYSKVYRKLADYDDDKLDELLTMF